MTIVVVLPPFKANIHKKTHHDSYQKTHLASIWRNQEIIEGNLINLLNKLMGK